MFIKKENSFIKKSWRKLDIKRIEGVTLDSFYFTEYWIEFGHAIFNIFNKTQKGEKLLNDLKTTDLSLRGKWLAAVASFLWYSLDKVFNIFTSMKDDAEFIRITSVDWHTIEVTLWMEILTKNWYKKACEITTDDQVMTVLWSNFSFKSWSESVNHVIMNDLLNSISVKFWNKDRLHVSNLEWDEKKVMYLIWLNPDEYGLINVDDLKNAQKFFSEKKKKVHTEKDEEDVLVEQKETMFEKIFRSDYYTHKNIKSIEKTKKTNIVVFNINTHVAENIIINNFIIRQNS